MFDTRFPPRNRRTESLPILRIEIEHAGGIAIFDPNAIIGLHIGPPRMTDVWDADAGWKPIDGRTSDVSGKPALLYRSDDLEIALTLDEMRRYTARALEPSEYLTLRDRFGTHFEIHADFYTDDGTAIQPIPQRADEPAP